MNKFIKILGFFFLIPVLFLMGCRNSAATWSRLYQVDGDHAVVLEETTDSIIEETTTGTREEGTKIDDIDKVSVSKDTIDENNTTVWVYICGAVETPGVYELSDGSRVVHAIEAAGGLREDADSLLINQAKVVEDGEQIRIYTKDEVQNMDIPEMPEDDLLRDSRININTAGMDELMTLPGIGQAKAEAIISYREEQGAFQSIEAIMDIPGIKDAVFSKIKDKITV